MNRGVRRANSLRSILYRGGGARLPLQARCLIAISNSGLQGQGAGREVAWHQRHHQLRRSSSTSSSSSFMTSSLLGPQHREILEDEKAILSKLADVLRSSDAASHAEGEETSSSSSSGGLSAELKLVEDAKNSLGDVFTLVVVGEFNAGKSTFINSLLGKKVLKDGVLPTTARVCILRHKQSAAAPTSSSSSSQSSATSGGSGGENSEYDELYLDNAFLRNLAIVDTPGTNALIERHEKLTQEIIPRSDLILFVTSAERPMSESESVLLRKICSWKRNLVVVLNKIDIIRDANDRELIQNFVAQNVARIVGSGSIDPIRIFAVSGRQGLEALSGLQGADGGSNTRTQLLRESNIESVEQFLLSTLSQQNILRDKLQNPVRMMERVVELIAERLQRRRELVEGDIRTLQFVDESMQAFVAEIHKDVAAYLDPVSQSLEYLNQHASIYIGREMNIVNVRQLMNAKEVASAFEKEVFIDISTTIETAINDIVNVIEKRAVTQQKRTLDYVGEREKRYRGAGVSFVANRTKGEEIVRGDLRAVMMRDAKAILSEFDSKQEAGKFANIVASGSMQSAALLSASLSSLLSLGAVLYLDAVPASVSDLAVPLGVMAAVGVGAGGLVRFSKLQNTARTQFSKRIGEMRTKFDDLLRLHITSEVSAVRRRIEEGLHSYSSHVRLESSGLDKVGADLEAIRSDLKDVRTRIADKFV